MNRGNKSASWNDKLNLEVLWYLYNRGDTLLEGESLTLRSCFDNIWFPQLLTISNMQLVFDLLLCPLFFSYRKAWQQPFFTLPISSFCAPRLMPTKFSRRVNRLMGYSIWYTIRGLTDAKCTWYLRILEKFIKLGTPTLKIWEKEGLKVSVICFVSDRIWVENKTLENATINKQNKIPDR